MDAIVIGGGPAGLQTALTLGRMHRSVLLLDSGAYRNAPASHLHNFITHDGRPPAEFRALAQADLAAYDTVQVRNATAMTVAPVGRRFDVTLDGGAIVTSDAIVLATGLRDVLPDVPGLAEHFGSLVHHCPFCHGHELAGKVIAIQGGPRVDHLTPMLTPIADRLVVTHPDIESITERDGRAVIRTADGATVEADGFFVNSVFEQSAPFAAQLGLTLLDSGCIEVDALGRTSLLGVYAAGDLAHSGALAIPMASVLNAAAAGGLAGAALVLDQPLRSAPDLG